MRPTVIEKREFSVAMMQVLEELLDDRDIEHSLAMLCEWSEALYEQYLKLLAGEVDLEA